MTISSRGTSVSAAVRREAGAVSRTLRERSWEDWPEGLSRGLSSRAVSRSRRLCGRALREQQHRRNFGGQHAFVDRSQGHDRMLMVLAGYKEYLWPFTLDRLEQFVPENIDVCLVSSAVASTELDSMAARMGWSRLVTKANNPSLAQNLTVLNHPNATWLFKLDEDIFIGEGFFERLERGYVKAQGEGPFDPGFCAPIMNVNGFSYRLFVEALGVEQAWIDQFGEMRQACVGVPAQADGDAARWLWEHSLPFDDISASFASRRWQASAVPHRFSIGAFVMRRELWAEIDGFEVDHGKPGVGADEAFLCAKCVDLSRVMLVLHDVFAGHFSFGPQDRVMRAAVDELAGGLEVRTT